MRNAAEARRARNENDSEGADKVLGVGASWVCMPNLEGALQLVLHVLQLLGELLLQRGARGGDFLNQRLAQQHVGLTASLHLPGDGCVQLV